MENPNAYLHPVKAFVDKGWALNLGAFRRFPVLAIMTGLMTVEYIAGAYYAGFCLIVKPDLRVDRNEKTPRYEFVNTDTRTQIIHKVQHKAIPELDRLRKEMGVYSYK